MRAEGYSAATRISLQKDNSDILRMIGKFINIDRRLRIADMGSGAGMSSIIMARMGHEVVSIDSSRVMLAEAAGNARHLGLDVEYVCGDVEDPPLEKGQFDLVLAWNTVWQLIDPVSAYESWKELLRPNGALVIIDGNYYLDLYDADYGKRTHFLNMQGRGLNNGLHADTNSAHVDFNIIREIAKDLPLSRERRPSWDLQALLGIGMTDIHIKSLDRNSYRALISHGLTDLPSNFVICARKPLSEDGSPFDDASDYRIIDNAEVLSVADAVNGTARPVVDVLKALADPNRMRIVSALMAGRLNVQQLSYITGESQSLTSHNLRILRDAGVAVCEKGGKESVYSLKDRYRTGILVDMCAALTGACHRGP